MARIVYSMAGEGRGHATRARALAESLRQRHELELWAPGQAYELLAPVYRGSEVRVERLPGVQFHYTRAGRMNYAKSLLAATPYTLSLPRMARVYARKLESRGADLAICDFEPILARAAHRSGVPLLGVDHQSFLLVNDLAGLPVRLRIWAKLMAGMCRIMTCGVKDRIVSSFYFPPLKKRFEGKVTQVGVLIRPELRRLRVHDQGRLLVYVRRHAPESFLQALSALGRPVDVFGLGARPQQGQVEFHEICARHFATRLASCHALVSTAGNQGVGEALFFGKPILAMPEHGNMEQEINAQFLAASGAGMRAELEKVDVTTLQRFLEGHAAFRAKAEEQSAQVDGLGPVLETIEARLRGAPQRDPSLLSPIAAAEHASRAAARRQVGAQRGAAARRGEAGALIQP